MHVEDCKIWHQNRLKAKGLINTQNYKFHYSLYTYIVMLSNRDRSTD